MQNWKRESLQIADLWAGCIRELICMGSNKETVSFAGMNFTASINLKIANVYSTIYETDKKYFVQ